MSESRVLPGDLDPARFREERRLQHPPFLRAVITDARVVSANRRRPLDRASDRRVLLEALRLAWTSDAFLGQALYRAKARLLRAGVPALPRILHRLAIAAGGVCIGDPVLIRPGVHLAHGRVVIDGVVEIKPGATISPFVTIGLRGGELIGPQIAQNVTIGSGARIIGPVAVGKGARVGANAVVLEDVPEGATVVGVPAAVVAVRESDS